MIIKISLTLLLTILSNSAFSLTFNQAKKELTVISVPTGVANRAHKLLSITDFIKVT